MADSGRPENADKELIRRMLDDGLWNLGIGAAAGLIVGAVLLPRGASGARAVLAGLGGGFGAGRVYERYNTALQDLQAGGVSGIPNVDLSLEGLKTKAQQLISQARSAVGMGTDAPAPTPAPADAAKTEAGEKDRA